MSVEDSAIAKSVGEQEDEDRTISDMALLQALEKGIKISKHDAEYQELDRSGSQKRNVQNENLILEMRKNATLLKEKLITNMAYLSSFRLKEWACYADIFPGDIVWDYIKKTGNKLQYDKGDVIEKGADGFQCKDCKYYLYYKKCLLINGDFMPEMSCGYVVKIGNGTEL